jgi:hypothetical protein
MRWSLCHPRHRHHRPANNEQNVSLPSGHWDSLGKVSATRTPQRPVHCAKASQGKHMSAIFPLGRWEVSRSLQHAPTVVDPKASVAVAQTRIKSSASANLPSGLWETLGLCRTYATVRRALRKRESGQARQPFPIGRWEVFKVSAARTPCI